MTAAVTKSSTTGPAALMTAKPSSSSSGSATSWIQRGTTTGSADGGGGSSSSGSWSSKSSSRRRGGGSSGSRSSLRWCSLIAPLRQSMGRARRAREHPLHRRRGRRPRPPDAAGAAARAASSATSRRSSWSTPRTSRAAWASRRRSPTSCSAPASTSSRWATTPTIARRSTRTWTLRSASFARPTTCAPSRGAAGSIVEHGGVRLGVVNLSGNLYLRAGRPAFVEIDAVLGQLEGKVDHVLVDMHAEATSEKVGMGWFLDGRATVVVGTHTHVPTADARVLPGRHRLHHRRRDDRARAAASSACARSRRSSRCAPTCPCASRRPRTTRGSWACSCAAPTRRCAPRSIEQLLLPWQAGQGT